MHPIINVEYLKQYHETPSEFAGRVAPRPEHILNPEIEPEYELAEIRGHKRDCNGNLRLLCHWSGYEDFDDTYEPEENLENSQEMLAAYKKKHKLA